MRIFVLCLGLLLPLALFAEEDTGDLWNIALTKVRDDIYVAHIPDPLSIMLMGNVTIIVNEHDVVLVDGGGSPVAARRIIAGIRKITSNPVTVVVETHGHADHTLGNQEYVRAWPGVQIIARPEARDYMNSSRIGYIHDIATSTESRKKHWNEVIADLRKENAPGDAALADYFDHYFNHDIDIVQREYRTVTITPPNVTFDGNLTLYRGTREIDVLRLGKGHTDGDVVVYLPKEKVIATGDLVVAPVPFGFDPNSLEGMETLDKISKLDFDTLIPGHGDVEHGRAYLDQLIALLRDIRAQVEPLLAKGLTLDDAQKRIQYKKEMDEFAGEDPIARWQFENYFIAPFVEGCYNELKSRSH